MVLRVKLRPKLWRALLGSRKESFIAILAVLTALVLGSITQSPHRQQPIPLLQIPSTISVQTASYKEECHPVTMLPTL